MSNQGLPAQADGRWSGRRRGEQSMVPDASPRSYYGQPILKEPVWKWPIPAYLFTGGLAGGSSLLALGSRVSGNRRLATQSRLVSLGALGVSTALLISDLGRPSRFYNMLRVFKPTSPMNVGTWLLSALGAAATAGAASDALGVAPRLGAAADAAAAAFGSTVATYTAVLVADTAVPAWHEGRRELPLVFAGGAALSAGGVAVALAPPGAAGPALRVMIGGTVTELAALEALRRRLGPELAEVYDTGLAGTLSRWAGTLAVAGTLVAAAGRRRRPLAMAGGVAAAAGAALERFAVFEAGKASVRDPRHVVGPQRQRLEAAATAARGRSTA